MKGSPNNQTLAAQDFGFQFEWPAAAPEVQGHEGDDALPEGGADTVRRMKITKGMPRGVRLHGRLPPVARTGERILRATGRTQSRAGLVSSRRSSVTTRALAEECKTGCEENFLVLVRIPRTRQHRRSASGGTGCCRTGRGAVSPCTRGAREEQNDMQDQFEELMRESEEGREDIDEDSSFEDEVNNPEANNRWTLTWGTW